MYSGTGFNQPKWSQMDVRRHYEDDENVRIFLDEMAERQRAPKNNVTSVDSLETDLGISRTGAIEVLRKFAASGCGSFKIGRRGQPSRIAWAVSPIQVAKAVRGPAAADEPQLAPSVSVADGPQNAQDPTTTQYIDQRIQLRPDAVVLVRVPANMSKEEAEKLANIVRNLWFHSDSHKD